MTVHGSDQTTLGAISESGGIVGAVNFAGPWRAARWNGSSQGELIPLPGDTPSLAFGLNESGTIVGLWYTTNGKERGFYHANGVTTVIEPLVGHNHTTLYDVNNAGIAVGQSTEVTAWGGGDTDAILVSNGEVRVLPLPNNVGDRVAYEINDHGQIVGQTQLQGPFVCQDGGSFFLRDLLGVPPLTMMYSYDINERGQIVGGGYDGTIFQGFVLTPCLGNLNRDPVIDSDDFDLFYRALLLGDELADVDENGIVDLDDETMFLRAWTDGC